MNLKAISVFSSSLSIAILRKSFNMTSYYLLNYLSLSKSQIGFLSSNFSIFYGVSKLVSGFLTDFIDSEVILFYGIFIGSLLHLSIPYITNLMILSMIYGISGLLLGSGMPALTKLCSINYNKHDISKIWSIITFASNLGYMIAPFIISKIYQYNHFYPCIAVAMFGLFISFLTLIAFNIQIVHKNIDITKSHKIVKTSYPLDRLISDIKVYLHRILTCLLSDKNIWLLMTCNFLITFCLKALSDWIGMLIIEML